MIIKNASVYMPEGNFEEKNVYIKGDEIVAIGEAAELEAFAGEVIDATGCYLIPGLTDMHFHGCAGRDFCEGMQEALDTIATYEASVGVTTIVPATMTLEEATLVQVCRETAAYKKKQDAGVKEGKALVSGIYLEGPFIAKDKMGAQNPAYIREPDKELLAKLQTAAEGLIRVVAIAPEVEGGLSFIEEYKEKVRFSLAHTTADYAVAMQAFEAGAVHVTHLYNAMMPFGHRAPGVVGAAFDAGAEVELICDGIHVHPAVVRATLQMFGEDKVIFVSDSMMATGLSDGDYHLGGQPVCVTKGQAVLRDGTIAGSVSNLMECMRTAVLQMEIPLETAIKCAAVNPAKSAGIYDKYGSIAHGKKANLVLLRKDDLKVSRVILLGNSIKNGK